MNVMPFGDHLEELRKRLIWAIVGIVPVMVVCLFFGGPLMKFMMVPLLDALQAAGEPSQLLATSPLETFGAYLKVATVVSLLVAIPWIVYQLWLFIAPGLYAQERRFVYFLIPLSAILTAAAMAFLYKILLPVSLVFLIAFGTHLVENSTPRAQLPEGVAVGSIPIVPGDLDATDLLIGATWINTHLGELRIKVGPGPDDVRGIRLTGKGAISQQYRIGDYISLVFTLGLVFAIAFQLPLALLLLSWSGILEAKDLKPYRRHATLIAGALGAILTPQDPGSMILLGGALYILFEFGLVLMRFVPAKVVAEGFGKKQKKSEPATTDGREGDE